MSQLQGRGLLVRDDVIHVGGAGSARISEPHHLDRSRTKSKDLVTGTLGVAVHVQQDVDTVLEKMKKHSEYNLGRTSFLCLS